MLCAIADTGSLGRAAVATGLTQPAVSGQLKRIERYFGAELFVRASSGVQPTRYGVEVVAQARDVVARADAIGRRRAGGPADAERTLRLAATNSPILPGLLARARAVLPDLALLVSSVYSSAQIVDQLEQGGLDVAVAVDYPGQELQHSAALAHRGIVTEPTFVALPADHPAAGRLEVPLAELADDAWFVTPDDGAGWPGVYYAACRTAGFAPAAVHEFLGDQLQLQAMIAEGMGISLVQATTKPISGVVVKPLLGTPLWCRYLLAWHRERLTDEVAETLFGAAAFAYQELIGRSPHFQTWASAKYRTPRS
jgi:DNA-binding transcriptional LysR family regulator